MSDGYNYETLPDMYPTDTPKSDSQLIEELCMENEIFKAQLRLVSEAASAMERRLSAIEAYLSNGSKLNIYHDRAGVEL